MRVINQQQPSSFLCLVASVCWSLKPSAVESIIFLRFNILATSWSKATRVAPRVLALVSTQTMPMSSATWLAFAFQTSRLSSRSILLPTRSRSILETSVFSLTSLIQKLTISNDFLFEMSNTSRIPSTFRQQFGVSVLYRAVPAVSQICTRITLLSSSRRVFCLYSTPIVVAWLQLNSSSTYWCSNELFPTQLSPIISSFTRVSSLPPLITIYYTIQLNYSLPSLYPHSHPECGSGLAGQAGLDGADGVIELRLAMIRSVRALRCLYRVVKRSNGAEGTPLANMEQFYLTDDAGKELSFWNDLPHHMKGDTVNCCIEVPKERNNKYEVIKGLKHHPLMQDTKKNLFDQQPELRHYPQFPLFNYGFIPRTWEQTLRKDENGLLGDDDPIDICDLSRTQRQVGAVFRGKVLGCFCLIDQGELDWKILVVDSEQAERTNIAGIWEYPQEQLQAIMQWFKTSKTFEGKQQNSIGYNEKILSKDATLNIIYDTHVEWKKLVASSDPVYDSLRKKFQLQGFHFEEQGSF